MRCWCDVANGVQTASSALSTIQSMSDEKVQPSPETSPRGEVVERRSAETVIQGVEAVGLLAGGVGGLLAGAAQWKKSSGGDDQGGQAPQAEPPPVSAESE